jgi:hypothetical protein
MKSTASSVGWIVSDTGREEEEEGKPILCNREAPKTNAKYKA